MAHFMPPENLEDSPFEDDYYALLNLDQNATPEDITNSYRRFSKLFHPDKHLDETNKKNSELLFNRTKTAYEVLGDPHKRAIYDTLGVKGLQTEGWQIAQRTKTPQEIRDEFEHLLQEKEQRRLQMRTNPKGTIIVGVNATELFESYEFEGSGFPNFEISSMTISQSVEAPLSVSDTANFNGSLSAQNGNGAGSIGCSLKKVVSSKSWLECGIGAGNGLVFSIKGFRTLSKRCFGTLQTSCQFTNMGIMPGLEFVLARQLDKQTAGYVTWKAGTASSINTMVVRDSEKGRLVAGLQIGIRASFITFNYTHKLEDSAKIKGAIKFGPFGAVAEYGCEKKISQHSTLGATMAIGVPSGVTLKIKMSRANQSFVFPILLSEEIIPSAVFYGTVAPIIGWYILKTCILDPYEMRQKKRESDKAKEVNADRMAEKKKEATIAVSLMQESYNRIKTQEEQKNGLIIIRAVYGNPVEIADIDTEPTAIKREVVDVKVQLQCLVKDSKLILPVRSKSNLPGFYDPCLGEDKCLLVDYNYRNLAHSITIKDNQVLRIPSDFPAVYSKKREMKLNLLGCYI